MERSLKTIAIVGAGALGAAYGSMLHDMDDQCISFVAGGDRLARLRRDGMIVNGRTYHIPVIPPNDLSAPSDLVIVAVKYHHLDRAIDEMKNRIGDRTVILSVMNGIDSEKLIGAAYGPGNVLYAVSVGIDALREENRVIYTTQGKLFVGEAVNPPLSERVKRVQTLFDRAGIIYETPPDMIRILWWKFMINVGINQASAVLRGTYAVFQTSEDARALMESAMREVIAIAKKAKVHLSEEDIRGFDPFLARLNPQGKTSMLQDVEAGRKTEVEMLAGQVIALGKRHDVPTPVNQMLFDAIKKIETASGRQHP